MGSVVYTYNPSTLKTEQVVRLKVQKYFDLHGKLQARLKYIERLNLKINKYTNKYKP